MTMKQFDQLLDGIGYLQKELKERSMIYQCERKEEVAEFLGLKFDDLAHLPYVQWVDFDRYVTRIERGGR